MCLVDCSGEDAGYVPAWGMYWGVFLRRGYSSIGKYCVQRSKGYPQRLAKVNEPSLVWKLITFYGLAIIDHHSPFLYIERKDYVNDDILMNSLANIF